MNIKKNIVLILSAVVIFGFIGCGGGVTAPSTSSTSDTSDDSSPKVSGTSAEVIDVSAKRYIAQKLTGNPELKLKLGSEPKDVYLFFSNPTTENISSATVTHDQKAIDTPTLKQGIVKSTHEKHNHPPYVQAFNADFSHLQVRNSPISDGNQTTEKLSVEKSSDLVNDSQIFYMDVAANSALRATARKVVNNVSTAYGEKSLSIWVEDDGYGSGCKKRSCITQEMVDVLADRFLKEGFDNDIYDAVTNVLGEEWGSSNYSNLIPKDDAITILLADIEGDNSNNGGVIGYFYSKDNLTKDSLSGSNERIMFYIDSVLYASGGDVWNESDYWPEQVFTTLAHEFQHMIHYYQKSISYEISGTQSWINEMLSECMEDLLAVKMGLKGPRYVDASRGDAGNENNLNGLYPLFNSTNSLVISSWDNSLADYSKVSSFGAYLLRNYGGAQLLHDMVHNVFTDEQAIVYAVNKHANGAEKSFEDLIHDWGIAVLMSKRDDLDLDSGFIYNTGDYISTQYNGINYKLGSINFFNYLPNPTLNSRMGTVNANGSYYYKVGDNLTGDVEVSIGSASDLTVSVVVVK